MDLLNHLLNRRLFTVKSSKLLLWMAVASTIPMTSCNWVQFLIDYIPVINGAISTISNFFGILLPPPVSIILTAIKAALLDLQGAAIEYQNAPAASKGNILGQMQVFLKGIVDNFQQVLDSLGSSGPIPAIVLGIVNIVLSTLSWLIGNFSSATSTVRLMSNRITMRDGNKFIIITPVKRSRDQFIADINSLLAANGRSDLKMS